MKHTFTCFFLLLAMSAVLILACGSAPKSGKRSLELKDDFSNSYAKRAQESSLNQLSCVQYTTDACKRRKDGDYLACDPLCQDGAYISCSGGKIFLRNCNTVSSFQTLVYDPELGRCEYTSPYCPGSLGTTNVVG